MFGKSKVVETNKPSIVKEYVVPFGTLLLAILSLFAQNTPPFWVSLLIALYIVIISFVLVVPVIIGYWKKWKARSTHNQLKGNYLPQLTAALRKFKPMIDSRNSDNVWKVWQNAVRINTQHIIRPDHSHFSTLSIWFDYLIKAVDSAKPSDIDAVAREASYWIQRYDSFSRDAYQQFETLLRDGQLNINEVRELKQSWNHIRDEHNQAITGWHSLCEEINASFDRDICLTYYEKLKTLE